MTARLILAALLAGALPAQASDRCADLAAMYHLAHGLRAAGLTPAKVVQQAAIFYPALPESERVKAVERVSNGGDLAGFSANTIFRHVYLECRQSA